MHRAPNDARLRGLGRVEQIAQCAVIFFILREHVLGALHRHAVGVDRFVGRVYTALERLTLERVRDGIPQARGGQHFDTQP